MKRALLFIVFIFSACAPKTVEHTPVPPGDLLPYASRTPSVTPEGPEGLVVSFETPLPSPTPFAYEVQAGDTLSEIAERFGISLDELITNNPDVSPNSMSIGTELKIPSSSVGPTGASTSTPVPAPVKQIECYPTADKGQWGVVLTHNDTPDMIENLSAQVTLLDVNGGTLTSALALSPLNILPPGASLPLMVFFPPTLPADVRPQAQLLTGIHISPDDARYLSASVHNTLVQVDSSGRSAQVSGTVRLPEDSAPANSIWVAAVAYNNFGKIVGVRRWESKNGETQFEFEVSSLAGEIGRVEFVVEARP